MLIKEEMEERVVGKIDFSMKYLIPTSFGNSVIIILPCNCIIDTMYLLL